MKVTCSQCLAVYNIPENKLKKDVSRTTCRKCGHRIEIRKPVGIPSIKPIFDSNEELSAPKPFHDVLSQAKPKRILDDERTILDEARSEQPRPAVMTNLAFGPDPSAKEFLDDSENFQAFPADTIPSIRSFPSEEEDPPTEERPPQVSVVEEESEEEQGEDENFRLDWVVAFCGDILGLVGIMLMVGFSGDNRFLWASMVALFGVSLSLMMGVSSRFGAQEGKIIVSILTSIIAVLLFNVAYIMMFPS